MATGLTNIQSVPKYLQVRKELVRAIQDGHYKMDQSLPPEKILAKGLNVSHTTLRQALSLLDKEGVVQKVPGHGNFVRRTSFREEIAQDVLEGYRHNNSIALMFADMPEEEGTFRQRAINYFEDSSRFIDQYLRQSNRSLALSFITTSDIFKGNIPPFLTQRSVSGVILDGVIDDYHVAYIRNLGIPLVAHGNRPLHVPVKQVVFDYKRAAYLLTNELLALEKKPVCLVSGPFKVHYLSQIFDGYKAAVREADVTPYVHILSEERNEPAEFHAFLDRMKEPFALLIDHDFPAMVSDAYRERGWTPADHPVIMFSKTKNADPDILRRYNVCAESFELSWKISVDLLTEAGEPDSTETVVIEPHVSSAMEDGALFVNFEWRDSRSDTDRDLQDSLPGRGNLSHER